MSDRPISPKYTPALTEAIIDILPDQSIGLSTVDFTNPSAAPVYLHLFDGAAGDNTIDAPKYVLGCGSASTYGRDLHRMTFPNGLSAALSAAEGSAVAASAPISWGWGAV